jgi:hypothetical protein
MIPELVPTVVTWPAPTVTRLARRTGDPVGVFPVGRYGRMKALLWRRPCWAADGLTQPPLSDTHNPLGDARVSSGAHSAPSGGRAIAIPTASLSWLGSRESLSQVGKMVVSILATLVWT